MPPLQEELSVLKNYPPDLRQFMPSKPPYLCQRNGLKPELGIPSCMGHVDVRWLAPLHAEEEEPVPADPK